MALPFDIDSRAHDGRALAILAKTIYRELRAEGYAANEVMALASELLGLVASEVKDRRAPKGDATTARVEPPVVEARP
jgi:hypothetical protein